jgi:hypothetical protein
MNKSDQWKSKQVVETFGLFRNQFDDYDDHSRVVLETIFEVIHGKKGKGLPVPSEAGQDSSKASDDISSDGKEDQSDKTA